jgi:hypothetical protein
MACHHRLCQERRWERSRDRGRSLRSGGTRVQACPKRGLENSRWDVALVELNPQKGTQKMAMATPIMASTRSHECLIVLIKKQWADSHFEAFYGSCICLVKRYYVKYIGQDLRQKADSAVNNFVQVHMQRGLSRDTVSAYMPSLTGIWICPTLSPIAIGDLSLLTGSPGNG